MKLNVIGAFVAVATHWFPRPDQSTIRSLRKKRANKDYQMDSDHTWANARRDLIEIPSFRAWLQR
jgi:hypothetical protein